MILVGAALLVVAAVGGGSLYAMRQALLNERQAQIVNMLAMAEHSVKYYYELEQKGKLTRAQAQDAAKAALGQMVNEGKSYYWIRNPDGMTVWHPKPSNIGKVLEGETMDGKPAGPSYAAAMAKDHIALLMMKANLPDGTLSPKLNGVFAFDQWNWWIGTGFFLDDINRTFMAAALTSLWMFLAGIAILSTLGWRVIRSVTGALGGEPDYAAEVTNKIAGNDLSALVTLKADDKGSLLHSIASMQEQLSGTVQHIRQSARSIATASQEIAAGNLDLSSRTEEQASSLEETAATMEELTATVKQNAGNASQATRLADDASQLARKGGAVVAQVVDTMGAISQSSQKVADIISVIDGIAFQTNILALNAAVEAARAGEQGRGFAVVATEVRNLAQRSATAAKEIKALIEDSVTQVRNGSTLVDQAGATMTDIVTGVQNVAGIMNEIMAASQEQTLGIEQINQAVTQMDAVTQQNAALVEEAAAAADSLQRQAAELAAAVSTFKLAGDTQALASGTGHATARRLEHSRA
jgi:methyl-accepting chemotaxis protein